MMLSDQAHAFVDQIAKLLELAGVGTIISGVLIATALFVFGGLRDRCWREAYEEDRSNLGRGILLGLELLVGADIISTITAPNYPAERRVTAGIVAIRTFLSPSERAATASSLRFRFQARRKIASMRSHITHLNFYPATIRS